jgi:hypothetical protein
MTTGSIRRVADAVTATAGRPGQAALSARAWLDTLAARAQIRSERRIGNLASLRSLKSQPRQTRVRSSWI